VNAPPPGRGSRQQQLASFSRGYETGDSRFLAFPSTRKSAESSRKRGGKGVPPLVALRNDTIRAASLRTVLSNPLSEVASLRCAPDFVPEYLAVLQLGPCDLIIGSYRFPYVEISLDVVPPSVLRCSYRCPLSTDNERNWSAPSTPGGLRCSGRRGMKTRLLRVPSGLLEPLPVRAMDRVASLISLSGHAMIGRRRMEAEGNEELSRFRVSLHSVSVSRLRPPFIFPSFL